MIDKVEGLRDFEYIDLGSTMLVQLAPNKTYKVGGREFTVNYGKKQLIFDKGCEFYSVTKPMKFISKYIKGDKELTVEEYESNLDSLQGIDDGFGNKEYESLEEEFRCRKLLLELQEYEPLYVTPPEEFTLLELVCVGVAEDTNSDYIATALSYGKGRFGNSGFYKLDLTKLVNATVFNFMNEKGLTSEFSLGGSGESCEFAKFKGNYLHIKLNGSKKGSYRIFTNLSEALEVQNSTKDEVIKFLNIKVFDKILSKSKLSEILNTVESIHNNLISLDVKAKSSNGLYNLLKKLNDFKRDLSEEINRP